MTKNDSTKVNESAPAQGERFARRGYGFQDRVATELTLDAIRGFLRNSGGKFDGVRLADLEAGTVDDFVLVWEESVQGTSIKSSPTNDPVNWGDLIGSENLLKGLVDGKALLEKKWEDREVRVALITDRPPSQTFNNASLVKGISVETFFRDHWHFGPRDSDNSVAVEAWKKILTSIGLSKEEFSEFLNRCEVRFKHKVDDAKGSTLRDQLQSAAQFRTLNKEISVRIDAHPDEVQIDRAELLLLIGYRELSGSLIQQFPLPKTPYARNQTSAKLLEELLSKFNGGYLALVGSAGVGKSTLVQDVLGPSNRDILVPYFAFLPENGMNRDRAEALTFFQDISYRFDRIFPVREGIGVPTIPDGRDALRSYMAEANSRFTTSGEKTILLIDGLDHAARELGLTSTVLHELPDPSEVPDGFHIILGSQPQGLNSGTIPANVAHVLSPGSDRRIEIEGLSKEDVFSITSQLPKDLSTKDHATLYESSRGNPLILGYMIKYLLSGEEITTQDVVSGLGSFEGDIDVYYASRLGTALNNGTSRQVLGLISRAVPTIPTNWLTTWPEWLELEGLLFNELAPFTSVKDGNVTFIHNSLVAFLKEATLPRIQGFDPLQQEVSYNSTLADRSEGRSCSDMLGRARLRFLDKAQRQAEILTNVTPEWIRRALHDFVPYAIVRSVFLDVYRAAWSTEHFDDIVKFFALDFEYEQRTSRIEPDDLAIRLLDIDQPELAILQIRSDGRLLAKDHQVLRFARRLWEYANPIDRDDLKGVAKNLFALAKPVRLIANNGKFDPYRVDSEKMLEQWSLAAPLFESPSLVVEQILGLNIVEDRLGQASDPKVVHGSFLLNALRTVRQVLDDNEIVSVFSTAILTLNDPSYNFWALFALYRRGLNNVSLDNILEALDGINPNIEIIVQISYILRDEGEDEAASLLAAKAKHLRIEQHSFARDQQTADVGQTVDVADLKEFYGLSQGEIPGCSKEGEEAHARIEFAARKIGSLRARARIDNAVPATFREEIRAILLYEHAPVTFGQIPFREKQIVLAARKMLYTELADTVALFGSQGLTVLKLVIDELLPNQAKAFYPEIQRMFALKLFMANVITVSEAESFGLSDVSDTFDQDPSSRQEATLEVCLFLHKLGSVKKAKEWMDRAATVGAGAQDHKDYHLEHMVDWIDTTGTLKSSEGFIADLEKLARANEIGGGSGKTNIARRLITLAMFVEPAKAAGLAIELVDRGILYLYDMLGAVVVAGGVSGASRQCLLSLYAEMILLISVGSNLDAITSVFDAKGEPSIEDAIRVIIGSIQTNSLPSAHVEILRHIQDFVTSSGLEVNVPLEEAKPSLDDSARSRSLYTLQDGSTITAAQMIQRLSSFDSLSTWNPNPDANKDFDWWTAIDKVTVCSKEHLAALEDAFSYKEYREVQYLAWKARQLVELGDKAKAKEITEEALTKLSERSWFRYYDGAQKVSAYKALISIDHEHGLREARKAFGSDLSSGTISSYHLLADIMDIFQFLEIGWPNDVAKTAVTGYVDEILSVNPSSQNYSSLADSVEQATTDEAICMLMVRLLGFPVVEIGNVTKTAIARFLEYGGDVRDVWNAGARWADQTQLEYILSAIHCAAIKNPTIVDPIENQIASLNTHESLAVRGIAKTICELKVWKWNSIKDLPEKPIILRGGPSLSETSFSESQQMIDGRASEVFQLYKYIFSVVLGVDEEELESAFIWQFESAKSGAIWSEERMKVWLGRTMARFWIRPSAHYGREAAMRTVGRFALEGKSYSNAEDIYFLLDPTYDPELQLLRPKKRASDMKLLALDRLGNLSKEWREGKGAEEWSNYPHQYDGRIIIGEKTYLIQPDWGWPREERRRCLLASTIDKSEERRFACARNQLTHAKYLKKVEDYEHLLTLENPLGPIEGLQAEWVGLNPTVAQSCGWTLGDEPFQWVDSSNVVMVESIMWRNGWTDIEPPHGDSTGKGWVTVASNEAIDKILDHFPDASMSMWVERHSYGEGEKESHNYWHLHRKLAEQI